MSSSLVEPSLEVQPDEVEDYVDEEEDEEDTADDGDGEKRLGFKPFLVFKVGVKM